MYEEETAINIENRMLDRIDGNKYDKRQGMIIQTSLAATAIELAKLYEELRYIDDQLSPLSSDRTHLESWCKTFSITPLGATYAIVKATIIMKEGYECPIGVRFSQNDLNFVVITKDGDNTYSLQCEQIGEVGNAAFGRIIPILNIPGLISANITGVVIPAVDVESDESLSQRLSDNFKEKSFGWNMAQYKQELGKIQGVGGFKVVRYFEEKDFWIGVYIIDALYQKASKELIELVQNTLLPLLPDYEELTIQNSGDGEVAIGHIPKVMTVDEVEINITLHIDTSDTTSYEELENTIKEKIQKYLTEQCNQKWGEETNLVVRISGIENAVLSIEGIVDVYDTEINGNKANLELGEFEITKLGTITKGEATRARVVNYGS